MKEQPFIVTPHAKSFTAEEIREMSEAVVSLKGLEEEKETLREIKEDREEYCEVSVILSTLSITDIASSKTSLSFPPLSCSALLPSFSPFSFVLITQ